MRTSSGSVCLTLLHEFAKEHPDCYRYPRKPERRRVLREYSELCGNIIKKVPIERGVYLWVCYEKNRLWKNIYLGLAGYGKTTSLRARISEELRDEKSFAWAGVLGEEEIRAIPDNGRKHRERAMLKQGATHIFWVTTPDLPIQAVHDLESDLIEALNPMANIKRPAPPHTVNNRTSRVFHRLRKLIHEERPT
jgi:hypothetical protein